ncbi:MAG: RidA family protein [Sandaracinaceae bacterium]
MPSPESYLEATNLTLPRMPPPVGAYRPLVVVDGMAYTSGHGPVRLDGTPVVGRLGEDLDLEAGVEAADLTALTMLHTLREELGSLDRVDRLVKAFGMVNAAPSFVDHPAVIDGFSQRMAAVFGPDRGIGARSAVGVTSLPFHTAVEIEAVFKLRAG